ncbi:head-tail adaptor protein [Enterococcus malodoratus]|uniref:head-tail adaptor protein n=1 Tax=Enterococcus malodoratus TaxID=71451 RepID=UPI0039AFA50C
MANKRVRETFNDGNLMIKTQVTKRNELKKKIGTSYENVAGPLRFKNLSIRESDLATMNAMDSRLSKKVKTPYHPIARKFNKDKYFIAIDDIRFNSVYVDSDNYYLYFYLEKVGDFSGNVE